MKKKIRCFDSHMFCYSTSMFFVWLIGRCESLPHNTAMNWSDFCLFFAFCEIPNISTGPTHFLLIMALRTGVFHMDCRCNYRRWTPSMLQYSIFKTITHKLFLKLNCRIFDYSKLSFDRIKFKVLPHLHNIHIFTTFTFHSESSTITCITFLSLSFSSVKYLELFQKLGCPSVFHQLTPVQRLRFT